MLLQTNSYIVPKDKRAEHARQIRRFRQTVLRLGCDHFEVYEQVGPNWSNSEATGRYVQIMRFVDRKHQLAVQAAERNDPTAQAVIAEFCELINFPYQQQQGLFAVGFYTSVLPIAPPRAGGSEVVATAEGQEIEESTDIAAEEVANDNGEQQYEQEPIPAGESPASANGDSETHTAEEAEPTMRISGSSENDLSEMVNEFLDVAEGGQPNAANEPTDTLENADPLAPFEHADHKETRE
jgi:hypothetical protein